MFFFFNLIMTFVNLFITMNCQLLFKNMIHLFKYYKCIELLFLQMSFRNLTFKPVDIKFTSLCKYKE